MKPLNLYKLIRNREDVGWDEVKGFIIAATSAQQARTMASENHRDERKEVWLTADYGVRCIKIGITSRITRPQIILASEKDA